MCICRTRRIAGVKNLPKVPRCRFHAVELEFPPVKQDGYDGTMETTPMPVPPHPARAAGDKTKLRSPSAPHHIVFPVFEHVPQDAYAA